MASSSKRGIGSADNKQRHKTFTTIVDPQQERIQMCRKFRNAWRKELQDPSIGYLLHPDGNEAFVWLYTIGRDSYMTSGRNVSLLWGFHEPTEVTFIHEYVDDINIFRLGKVKNKRINYGNNEREFKGYIIYDFTDDRVFGWEQILTEAYASNTKNQVLHIPTTANEVLRDNKTIILRTQEKLDGTVATVKRNNNGGRLSMYLTEGWYTFNRANDLKMGDKLQIQLTDPPNAMVVRIIRCPPTM